MITWLWGGIIFENFHIKLIAWVNLLERMNFKGRWFRYDISRMHCAHWDRVTSAVGGYCKSVNCRGILPFLAYWGSFWTTGFSISCIPFQTDNSPAEYDVILEITAFAVSMNLAGGGVCGVYWPYRMHVVTWNFIVCCEYGSSVQMHESVTVRYFLLVRMPWWAQLTALFPMFCGNTQNWGCPRNNMLADLRLHLHQKLVCEASRACSRVKWLSGFFSSFCPRTWNLSFALLRVDYVGRTQASDLRVGGATIFVISLP